MEGVKREQLSSSVSIPLSLAIDEVVFLVNNRNIVGIMNVLSNFLNSIDSVAKETLETDVGPSATDIRKSRRLNTASDSDIASGNVSDGVNENNNDDILDIIEDSGTVIEVADVRGDSCSDISTVIADTPAKSDIIKSSSSTTTVHDTGLKSNVKNNYTPGPIALSTTKSKPSIVESVSKGTDDLKKSIKDKDLEIEKLNAECLELEDKCASLTKEAKEAWESYRISQERAAARETELLDEVKEIQRAKAAEKQQIVGQISKSQTEMESLIKQINTLQDEKNSILAKLDEMDANEKLWMTEKVILEEDLFQARSGSVQGVQSLRDELSQALSTADQLRSDYATLTKLSQIRQQELEQQNQELERSLTEKDREIAKVNIKIQQYDRNNPNTKEIDELNKKIESLSLGLEEEKEKTVSLEKKLKQSELAYKAAQISWDDNRTSLDKVIHDLKIQLKQERHSSITPVLDTDADKMMKMQEELDNYVAQVHTLTRQLLNKQGTVLELQAERAALKSRVADLQTRNAKNELQLTALRDIEADEYDDNNDSYSAYDNSNNTRLGLQRRSKTSNDGEQGGHKVISGLKQMGVNPNASVVRAVNYIDTWTLITGRLLRNYPLLRLGFVLYLLFLHLWVLCILAWQTHSLEMENDPKELLGSNLNAHGHTNTILP